MKKMIYLLMIGTLVIGGFNCKGPKTVADKTSGRVRIELEECEQKSLEKSEFLRGYGQGKSLDKSFARQQALAVANNEVASQVKALMGSFLKKYNDRFLSQKDQQLNSSEQGKIEAGLQQLVQEELKGSKIICSSNFMAGNEYEVNICVELTGVDFSKKVYDLISQDEKLKINYDEFKFREEWKKELEDYRANQGR